MVKTYKNLKRDASKSEVADCQSPWNSGLFYVVVTVLYLLAIVVVVNFVPPSMFAPVIISAACLELLSVVSQLVNDRVITSTQFSELVQTILRKISGLTK